MRIFWAERNFRCNRLENCSENRYNACVLSKKGMFEMEDTWCDEQPDALLVERFRFYDFRGEYKVQ